MKEIKIETIKKALLDNNFRKLYPELQKEIDQWINNPDCKCNNPLYNAIINDTNTLKKYFGEDILVTDYLAPIEPEQLNQWTVINCHIDELEEYLQKLPSGPKQIAVARWEDQVTIVINDPVFN